MKILWTMLLIGSLWAGTDFNLRSLKDVSSQKIQTQTKKNQIFMVFQEGCTACQAQVSKFNCLNLPVTLLGAFSTERGLRKEYGKMRPQYPGYLASQEILKNLGISQDLTPQIVLVTPQKKYLFQGLTECQKIKKYMVNKHG